MSVRKSLAWAFAGQAWSVVILFAGSVAVARLLSPHEIGIYAVAVAISGVLSLVAASGVTSYVVREAELAPATLDTAFTINALIDLGLAAAIFVVGMAGGAWLGDHGVATVLQLLALQPLINIFEFRPAAMLQRAMQFRAITLANSGGSLVNVAVTVTLAATGFSYLSMACGLLAGAAFNALFLSIAAPGHVAFRASLAGGRPMLAFGVQMVSVSGVAVLAQRISDIVLGSFLGLAALGIYSRASALANMLFANLYGTATRVAFVKLCQDQRERGEITTTFLRAFSMILGLMWPLLAGIAVLAGPLVHILYGDKWLAAALPLSLLMLALFFTLSFGMNWELFVIRGRTAEQTKYEIIRSFLGLVLFSAGAMFGIAAAALGRVLDALLGAIFYYPKMAKLSQAPASELRAIYAANLALTVAAAAPAFALMSWQSWDPRVSPLAIAGAVALGGLLWLASLQLVRHPLLDEMRLFLRRSPLAASFRRQGA